MPFCHLTLRAGKPKNSRYPKELRTIGDRLKSRRLDLGLLQREVAKSLGVSVRHWELGRKEPKLQYHPTLREFLGEEPPTESAAAFPEALRAALVESGQYTSIAFGARCREVGVRPSMGSVGDCYDNAMCESFFATLECELLDKRRFPSQAEAKMAVFDFIEGWYNPRRRRHWTTCRYERRNWLAA